jgi:hypothetical protein
MSERFAVGDRVVDTEDEEPNTAIVVLTPNAEATDWEVEDGDTVADYNPSYDADEYVVIVVFEEDLEDWWEDWHQHKADELFDEICERGHKFYAFPEGRLSEALDPDQIEEALAEAGFPTDRRDDTVVVEKFGEHLVRPDGTVEGEGAVERNVEKVVDDLTDS